VWHPSPLFSVEGETANATISFSKTTVAGISLLINRWWAYGCEAKNFWVDGVDGRLENDRFIFNEPRTMNEMVVVINETFTATNLVCLRRWDVLGAVLESGTTSSTPIPTASRARLCREIRKWVISDCIDIDLRNY
jgi:hypothetical protein